ncbi:NAC domain-containing protein 83-like [Cornus florida]|uniref:NAC domain-containing protein 83-like n=1 Tax=Cornus florida TaxID=4283 RepID=UPI0028A01F81|nr:NAC domain-containing protein 83-like [Cornus florida]
MEGRNVVVSSGNGVVMKLPVGFRFRPTDEELVVHYLKRKVYSAPLPATVIPEFDHAYQINPWDLPGDSKEKRYFFSKRRSDEDVMKYKCSRMSSSSCGYWKAIGKEKHILSSRIGIGNGINKEQSVAQLVVVGLRKTLHFYHTVAVGNQPIPTTWVMHQFRLVPSPSQTTPNQSSKSGVRMKKEDWVVCCIYQKKRKSNKNRGLKTLLSNTNKVKVKKMRGFSKEDSSGSIDDHDDECLGPPPQPSLSTCSSGISCNGSYHKDQEEEATTSYLCFHH